MAVTDVCRSFDCSIFIEAGFGSPPTRGEAKKGVGISCGQKRYFASYGIISIPPLTLLVLPSNFTVSQSPLTPSHKLAVLKANLILLPRSRLVRHKSKATFPTPPLGHRHLSRAKYCALFDPLLNVTLLQGAPSCVAADNLKLYWTISPQSRLFSLLETYHICFAHRLRRDCDSVTEKRSERFVGIQSCCKGGA